MSTQLQLSPALNEWPPGGLRFAFARQQPRPEDGARKPYIATPAATGLPPRPDPGAVNPSIPIFYIGKNRKGIWVVREADGRSGGLFFLKQTAVRFARRQSEPAGCAMMFVAEPFELDVNAGPTAANELAACRTELIFGVFRAAVAAWRKFSAYVSRNIVAQRRNRAAIEQELFGGRFTLASKNDDDLPVVR